MTDELTRLRAQNAALVEALEDITDMAENAIGRLDSNDAGMVSDPGIIEKCRSLTATQKKEQRND
jgi:hypothetical protein